MENRGLNQEAIRNIQAYQQERCAHPLARARRKMNTVAPVLIDGLFGDYTDEQKQKYAEEMFWKTFAPGTFSHIGGAVRAIPSSLGDIVKERDFDFFSGRFWRLFWHRALPSFYDPITKRITVGEVRDYRHTAHEATHYLGNNTSVGFNDLAGASAVDHYFGCLSEGVTPSKPQVFNSSWRLCRKNLLWGLIEGLAEHNLGFSKVGAELGRHAAYLESKTNIPISGLYFIGQVCKGRIVADVEREVLDPTSLARIQCEGLAQKHGSFVGRLRRQREFVRTMYDFETLERALAEHKKMGNAYGIAKCEHGLALTAEKLNELTLQGELGF